MLRVTAAPGTAQHDCVVYALANVYLEGMAARYGRWSADSGEPGETPREPG